VTRCMVSASRKEVEVRNRITKVGTFIVATAIGLVVVACTSGPRDGQDATTPADEPSVAPVDATVVEVATDFVDAFGAFDADRALGDLADGADLAGLNGVDGSAELRLLLSLLEAQGYEQMGTSCRQTGSSASGTDVRCTFEFHAIRSDEIGRGPYSGSYFDLTVRDGEIVRPSLYWETKEFSTYLWEPFATWVSERYPKDGAVMYNASYSDFLLSEESIRLWEEHSREYVKEMTL
jgi:hypothetical protein